MSQAVVDETGIDSSTLDHRLLELKGKADTFDAWVWKVGDPEPSRVFADN